MRVLLVDDEVRLADGIRRGLEAEGMTYAICYFPEIAYDTSGLELFEREVIPAFA